MTSRTSPQAKERDAYGFRIVRDTAARLAAAEPADIGDTADALIDLAAHLRAAWFDVPGGEDEVIGHLQGQAPGSDVRNGLELAKHWVDEGAVELPTCPWPKARQGKPENLQRGRPDRKRAHGAVNIAEGEESDDPRQWRTVPFHKWLMRLLDDPDVVQTKFAVAVALGSHAHWKTGASAFASQETIGRKAGVKARMVSTYLRQLEAAGWIRDTRRRRGQNGSTEYRLTMPPEA